MALYDFMEKSLKIEKDLESVIYIIGRLEQSFSEEDKKEEKLVTNGMLLSLQEVQRGLHSMIQEFDKYIVKCKGQKDYSLG